MTHEWETRRKEQKARSGVPEYAAAGGARFLPDSPPGPSAIDPRRLTVWLRRIGLGQPGSLGDTRSGGKAHVTLGRCTHALIARRAPEHYTPDRKLASSKDNNFYWMARYRSNMTPKLS